MNSYSLTRKWFDFISENSGKVKPQHTSLYMFAIEHCNRLGWQKEFGFPTSYSMIYTGIATYKTYIKTFSELVEFGFIRVLKKSKNQYSANIISLVGFDSEIPKKPLSALDRAIMNENSENNFAYVDLTKALPQAEPKHYHKHYPKQNQSVDISRSSINKPTKLTKLTKPQNQLNYRGVIEKFFQNFENAPLENKNVFFNKILKREDFREFLKRENLELSTRENPNEKGKEKSSAKKEKEISKEQQEIFKNQFIELVPTYYWQAQDDKYLLELLQKLSHLIEQTGTSQNLLMPK